MKESFCFHFDRQSGRYYGLICIDCTLLIVCSVTVTDPLFPVLTRIVGAIYYFYHSRPSLTLVVSKTSSHISENLST